MSNKEYKVCHNAECNQEQPIHISGFSKNKKSKDGLQYWCKECMKKYKKSWLKDGNIYKHWLYKQAEGGFNRGQADYNIPPYEDVLTEFESVQEFYEYLLSNEEYVSKNNELVDKYLETGEWFDKPSIGRIDHSKGYIKGNMRCESMGEQVKAIANRAYIGGYLLKFQNEIIPFKSLSETIKHFGISESDLKEVMNTGGKIEINEQKVEFATVEYLEQRRKESKQKRKELRQRIGICDCKCRQQEVRV